MLEAGTVRPKNTNNILFKNLMDASLGAICFWLLGYSFAFGNGRTEDDGKGNDNRFVGSGNWALQNFNNDETYHLWFFQWTFASAATTIVSGSVAERCRLEAYFIYTTVLMTFVYPVVVHWAWSSSGWASPFSSADGKPYLSMNGAIDFAGSCVVHATGGFAGLVGTTVLGPRHGFHGANSTAELKGSSELLCSLGVGILWMGWYGFNCGSTLAAGGLDGRAINLAAKVAANTTISASMGVITAMTYSRIFLGHYNLTMCLNGVLAGCVSITAGCATVEPWASMMIGAFGGMVYIKSSALLKHLNIDDPLDAFPVHGCCGVWGTLAVGIFSTRSNIIRAYGFDNDAVLTGNQFGNQVVLILAVVSWTVGMSCLVFVPLNLLGLFRITAAEEKLGLDVIEHGIPGFARNNVVGGPSGKHKSTSPMTEQDYKMASP
eukprot:1316067-Amorphochlora_amoeboformis.AAC.1